MFNHDPKDDPYDPNWRRTIGRIRVDIKLETTGVSPEGLQHIYESMQNGKMFIVHNGKDSLIAFYPEDLKSWHRTFDNPDVWTKFADFQQMADNLKLCLFEHNHVVIPSAQLLDSDNPKLLNNGKDN